MVALEHITFGGAAFTKTHHSLSRRWVANSRGGNVDWFGRVTRMQLAHFKAVGEGHAHQLLHHHEANGGVRSGLPVS